jgi:hypothetical protein
MSDDLLREDGGVVVGVLAHNGILRDMVDSA